MIRGMHGMFYSSQAEALRTFIRDRLGLAGTDVGGGWLIFDAPEADLGVHPIEDGNVASGTSDISFYCDDIAKTVAGLRARGVEFTQEVEDHGYGWVTFFKVPGDFKVQLYQAKYTKRESASGVGRRATGSFDVAMKPQSAPDETPGAALGRMSLDKQFRGDLEALGQGEMLTAMTGTPGSAGYVAIERVSGTLHGRRGSFVLQHTGTMNRGAQQLSITVVSDSGTGELTGLAGKLSIDIVDGKHLYTFEYVLPT